MRSSISIAALALLAVSVSVQANIIAGSGPPGMGGFGEGLLRLQATGDVNRLDSQIFEDIHKNHVWLYDERSITAWVGKHGVDVSKFTAAFRSFGVNTALGQAEQQSVDYRVSGVPTLAIAGKYTVSGEQARILSTSDQLIVMARKGSKPAEK